MRRIRRALSVMLALVLIAAMGVMPASAETLERPVYHFTPKMYWASDPNGLVYFNGTWHMFYQNIQNVNGDGPPEWGHATSTDLIHWEHQPRAIYRDPELGMVFSGSAVVDANNTSGLFAEGTGGIVAIYTNNGKSQQQSIAYSPDGYTWKTYEGNPVIPFAEDPLQHVDFRDPKVFWHEESGQWMMILAGGPVRFFSSDNLIDWRPEGTNPEIMTECPDLYQLPIEGSDETRWVLSEGGRYYRIGDFQKVDGKWKFVPDPDNNGRYVYDFGPDAYAAQTYSNTPDGGVISTQWMSTWGYATLLGSVTHTYNGTYTLNVRQSLYRDSAGRIRMRQTPHEVYETLRDTANKKAISTTLTPGGANPLADWSGTQYELVAEFTPDNNAKSFGLELRVGEDKKFTLSYSCTQETLVLDRCEAGAEPERSPFTSTFERRIPLPEDGKLRLRIFVDSTSVEVFVNDGEAVGSILMFPDESHTGISAYSKNGSVKMDLTMYPMVMTEPPATPESSAPSQAPTSSAAASAPTESSGVNGTASSVTSDAASVPTGGSAASGGWVLPVAIAAGVVVVAAGAAVTIVLVRRKKKSA